MFLNCENYYIGGYKYRNDTKSPNKISIHILKCIFFAPKYKNSDLNVGAYGRRRRISEKFVKSVII